MNSKIMDINYNLIQQFLWRMKYFAKKIMFFDVFSYKFFVK